MARQSPLRVTSGNTNSENIESDLGAIADIDRCARYVWFVPKADIGQLTRKFGTLAGPLSSNRAQVTSCSPDAMAPLVGPAKPSRRDDGIRLDGMTIITSKIGDCHCALNRKDAKSNRTPRYDLNMTRLRYDSAYSITAHYAKRLSMSASCQ